MLRTRQVASGELTARLEEAFRQHVGTRFAAAVSSGTAALHLGLLALGIGPGDEVLAPSYACVAVLQAIRYTGAQARLLDIEETTLNVTGAMVRRRLGKRTKAIIVTHTFGFPAPLEEVLEFGVPVIEDCALALGATYRGRPVGSLGAVSVFSLYATKVICAGEGGMVCTNDRRIIRQVRDLNGLDLRANWRTRYNYKLSDLAAGLALSQMRKLPAFVVRRRAIAARYREAWQSCPVQFQQPVPGAESNYYRFVIRTARARAVIRAARRVGIWCDHPIFRPLHRYGSSHARSEFPGTEAVFRSTASIPIYPGLSEKEIRWIIPHMRKIYGG